MAPTPVTIEDIETAVHLSCERTIGDARRTSYYTRDPETKASLERRISANEAVVAFVAMLRKVVGAKEDTT